MITFLRFTTKVWPLVMGMYVALMIAGQASWFAYVALPCTFLLYRRDWNLLQDLEQEELLDAVEDIVDQIERKIKDLDDKE